MSSIRKIKRNREPKVSSQQLSFHLTEATVYQRGFTAGFSAGTKEQRESDINCLVDLLNGLEEWHGIGEITAGKIRDHFMSKFGGVKSD